MQAKFCTDRSASDVVHRCGLVFLNPC